MPPSSGCSSRTPPGEGGSLLLPATAGLGPLQQMVYGTEVVWDPVLAAMTDEQNVDVTQFAAAVRAGPARALVRRWRVELARLPVRALDSPRDHVLEPAEGGPSVTGRLVQAKSVV